MLRTNKVDCRCGGGCDGVVGGYSKLIGICNASTLSSYIPEI